MVRIPICSMYGIFTNIGPKDHLTVGEYTIHGASGIWGRSTTNYMARPGCSTSLACGSVRSSVDHGTGVAMEKKHIGELGKLW